MAAMSDEDRARAEAAHARKHHGQDWGCEPVLPYHVVFIDMLHMYLNVYKKAL